MARRPIRRERPGPRPEPTRAEPSPPTERGNGNGGTPRARIIRAFMDLLAEKRFENIDYSEIASRAGLSLAELRAEFGSKLEILAARAKMIDRAVLAGGEAGEEDAEEETPRERLFDVLMRRLDEMANDKAAIDSLLRSARANPPLALFLNGIAVSSQQWMLTAAGIRSSGLRGAIRAQGLAVLFSRVLDAWIDDDDPGLARTMSVLDRALARGQRWSAFLDDVCAFTPTRCLRMRRRRRRRYDDDGGEEAVAY